MWDVQKEKGKKHYNFSIGVYPLKTSELNDGGITSDSAWPAEEDPRGVELDEGYWGMDLPGAEVERGSGPRLYQSIMKEKSSDKRLVFNSLMIVVAALRTSSCLIDVKYECWAEIL